MKLIVKGFEEGGEIPPVFTCDGADISPEVGWSEVPSETAHLALLVDDPDAPMGTFTHWIIYNIAPSSDGLEENRPRSAVFDDVFSQGKNDFGKTGYGGPCPPRGRSHRYIFRLLAISSGPDLDAGLKRSEFDRSVRGRILEESQYIGKYRRK